MAGVNNADSCEVIAESSTIGLVVFLAWDRLVFWLFAIFTDLHNCSIFCQFYRLIVPTPATIMRVRTLCACGATIISRPPLLSRAPNYSEQLINNDNRCRWESEPTADSPTGSPCLIIIIIHLYFYTKGYWQNLLPSNLLPMLQHSPINCRTAYQPFP